MSVVKAGSCNLTKYIKVSENRWRHCPVVKGSTGRVKPDQVMFNGIIEVHPEGYYSIEWYEGSKRRRLAVGKKAAQAQQVQEQQNILLGAKAHGIEVKENVTDVMLADACAEFLEETRQQRTRKTLAQYTTALEYFQASCPRWRNPLSLLCGSGLCGSGKPFPTLTSSMCCAWTCPEFVTACGPPQQAEKSNIEKASKPHG